MGKSCFVVCLPVYFGLTITNYYPCLGSVDTLRHIKKDITEARKGSECGLSVDNFSRFQEGDKIQSYEETEKLAQL